MASIRALGNASRVDLVQNAFRKATLSPLNCFVSLANEKSVTELAQASDKRWQANKQLSLLDGIPVCFKDAFCTSDLPTTAGSKMLANYQSSFEATSVSRLLGKSGAIMIGKNNMDEFSMGSSNIHSYFGPVKNPLDDSKSPGGSSGGTAAAVASGCAFAGLGTDTGGSVRQPAAMCGIVGFKPTYGAISRHGVIAMSSSLDTVGILARNVDDAALVFEAIRGPDDFDSSADEQVTRAPILFQGDLSNVRVAVSSSFYPEEMDPSVVHCWQSAAKLLGWNETLDLTLKYIPEALATYYTISSAEAASNLSRYDGLRFGHKAEKHDGTLHSLYKTSRQEGFGAEAQRRIEMGNFVLSQSHNDEFFVQAQKVRRLIAIEFEKAFEQCDIIMVPTVAQATPPSIQSVIESSDPIQEWMSDLLTVPSSLAGLPSISVPVGHEQGFPISVQLIGRRFEDDLVLKMAAELWKKSHQ